MSEESKRILILEDDLVAQRLLSVALSKKGYLVTVVEDGAHGLFQYISNAGWAAVILDLRMPKVGGLDFLKIAEHLHWAGTLRAPSRIIVNTAVTKLEDLQILTNFETVHCVLQKPLNVAAVLDHVQSVTSQSAVEPVAYEAEPGHFETV